MCGTQLAANTGRKSRQKSPSGHHRTTSTRYIFAIKARIDNRKKLLSISTSCTCPYNMVNFGPLVAENISLVWGTPANFIGFRVLTALLHGIQQCASAKLCGVEQRAPPMFGRVTITFGIGPHSNLHIYTCCFITRFKQAILSFYTANALKMVMCGVF